MPWKLSVLLLAFINTSSANFLDFSVCPGKPAPVDGPLLVFSEVCKRRSVSLATGSNICNISDVKVFQVIFNVNEINPGITANVSATKFEKTAVPKRIFLPIAVETASIDNNLKNEKDFNGTAGHDHQFHRYIILNINIEVLSIPRERYSYVFRGKCEQSELMTFQLKNQIICSQYLRRLEDKYPVRAFWSLRSAFPRRDPAKNAKNKLK